MTDDIVILFFLAVIFFAGFGIGLDSDEKILAKFPICIEKKVGLAVIKKCYAVVEVTK